MEEPKIRDVYETPLATFEATGNLIEVGRSTEDADKFVIGVHNQKEGDATLLVVSRDEIALLIEALTKELAT